MNRIKAFMLGVVEFRTDVTTNPGEHLIPAYDAGREFVHVITFRYFDG